MTTTFNKIAVFAVVALFVFGVFSYITSSNIMLSNALAVTGGTSGCGSCGTGGTTGGTTGGVDEGGGIGDREIPAPTCDISSNVSVVNSGDQYIISWRGTPTNGTFKVNDYPVSAVGQKTYTFTAANYSRFVFTGQSAGGTCVDEVRVDRRVEPLPTCTLNLDKTTIVSGDKIRLTWTSANTAGIATIDQGIGNVDPRNTAGVRELSPTQNTTYTMTVRNSVNQTATCSRTVTVNPVTPPTPLPTCVLNADKTTIVSGNKVRLTWTSTNAAGIATIDQNIGDVDPRNTAGYREVSPTGTITYTMTVKNSANQTATCARTITVTPPAPAAPRCDNFDATPLTITRGQSSVLSWNTTNATAAVISNGVGNVAVDGSSTVSPLQTTTYTMTLTGTNNQSAVCTRTITVNPVTPNPLPTCVLNADKTTIVSGNKVRLTWTSTNAAGIATIDQNIGDVDPRNTAGYREVSPTGTITYTMTVKNSANQTATCARTITVTHPNVFTCSNNVNFYASRTSIDEGEATSLIWTTNGVTSLSISNINANGLSGNVSVAPNSDTTYTMTASNGSQTISCPVTVSVDEDNNGGGGSSGGSTSPRCTLKISDSKISRGDRVTLKWDTSRATAITLKDNHGKTIVTTDGKSSSEKKDLYDGEITLRPTEDTTYTLLAERGSRDRSCKVSVDVQNGGIVVTEIRDQNPVVTGIALTQVPYTGFEAGPFLTMVFYGLLLLWALYLAYVLVIRRNNGGNQNLAYATVPAEPTPLAPVMAVNNIATPRFVASTATAAVATPVVVGYGSTEEIQDEAYEGAAAKVEDKAHAERVLISSEAMRYFINVTTEEIRDEMLTNVLAKAKASYPAEDGWVVLNIDRMKSVTAAVAPVVSVFTPRTLA